MTSSILLCDYQPQTTITRFAVWTQCISIEGWLSVFRYTNAFRWPQENCRPARITYLVFSATRWLYAIPKWKCFDCGFNLECYSVTIIPAANGSSWNGLNAHCVSKVPMARNFIDELWLIDVNVSLLAAVRHIMLHAQRARSERNKCQKNLKRITQTLFDLSNIRQG